MEVVIVPGGRAAEPIGGLVADAIEFLLRSKQAPVLGLATGSSPLPVYAELVRRHREGRVSFAHARAFLLDEYVGLDPSRPQSYRRFIDDHIGGLVDFADDAVAGPDAMAEDLDAACAAYERAIREAGGVDLQLLGIGRDGHIGFNEPSSSLASRTRLKTLTMRTRADNARFFDSPDEVPHHVLTQGIGTILEARHLVLVAIGAAKAEAIAKAVEGPVSARCPASALQLHPHATVVIDEAAASALELADYYRETYAAKPAWQRL
jgi:glucosamine-6-phosphate deaminase